VVTQILLGGLAQRYERVKDGGYVGGSDAEEGSGNRLGPGWSGCGQQEIMNGTYAFGERVGQGLACNARGLHFRFFQFDAEAGLDGSGDGAVEIVLDIFEDRHKATVVDDFTCGAERCAGAQFFEDVVHLRHREIGVCFLATFAVDVELFGEEPDAVALWFGGRGNGKGSKQRVLL